MKYVQNNGRYAVSFKINVNGKDKEIILDRRRIFLDTGNVATTGISEVEDTDYDVLKEVKQFKALLEKGEMKLVDKETAQSPAEKVADLKQENAQLKAQLEKAEAGKATAKELKAKDKEIESLKAQLEALTKKESEGF